MTLQWFRRVLSVAAEARLGYILFFHTFIQLRNAGRSPDSGWVGGDREREGGGEGGFDFGHYCSCREELKLIPLGSTSVLHHTNACFRGFLRGEVLHLSSVAQVPCDCFALHFPLAQGKMNNSCLTHQFLFFSPFFTPLSIF